MYMILTPFNIGLCVLGGYFLYKQKFTPYLLAMLLSSLGAMAQLVWWANS